MLPVCLPDPQSECPLFTLPRELRDEIYEHYVLERDGYHHNVDTGKLSLVNRKPIDLRLMHTCRAIAQEMKDVGLRTNTVTFKTGDFADQPGILGLQSRAGRVKRVTDDISLIRWRMLACTLVCVKPAMFQETATRFGDGGRRLVENCHQILILIQGGPEVPHFDYADNLIDDWHVEHGIDESIQYNNALQYILWLASADARFKKLALQAFDDIPGTDERWNALQIALRWAHIPWEIIPVAQLASLETVLSKVQEVYPVTQLYEYYARFPWFFSAAAIAINYLSLQPQKRKALRQIILLEDHTSVSNPEAHMRGFAQFRKENPKLRIVRYIDLWSSMCPLGWHAIMYNPRPQTRFAPENARAPIFGLVKWLNAEMISREHLPEDTYSLEIEGFTTEVWDLVRHAVILQVAMSAYPQPRLRVPPPDDPSDWDSMQTPYSLPSHFPKSFVVAMKEFLERKNNFLSFVATQEPDWDYEELLQRHLGSTPESYYDDWQELLRREFSAPRRAYGHSHSTKFSNV